MDAPEPEYTAFDMASAQTNRVMRKYQAYLDASTPYVPHRWVFTATLLLLFFLRIILAQGWYIVAYCLGIYLLNLFLAFLQPKFDPSLSQDEGLEDGGDGGVGGSNSAPRSALPTKQDEEFRPFIRRLPEFKFWYSATRMIVGCFLASWFEIFNLPVFWPVLVIYWIILFSLTSSSGRPYLKTDGPPEYRSIVTILFPVFASYKALRTSDPAQLTPWLIYWIILSLILLAESWTVFIIGWLPFYSWIRLCALSYLVLPQTQGAKLLYANFVEPFITKHERQIEVFIGDLHEKGGKIGLGYLKQIIELVRERFLGFPPTRQDSARHAAPPPPPTATGYAQNLLSRFAMPAARAGPSTLDFYSMLSGAVAAATTTSASPPSSSRTPSGGIRSINPTSSSITSTKNYPTGITTNADKQSFLTSQREKLAILIKALDREQRDLDLAYGSAPGFEQRLGGEDVGLAGADVDADTDADADAGGFQMGKSRSDVSFQNIERDELDDDGQQNLQGTSPMSQAAARNEKTASNSSRRGRTGGSSSAWSPGSWFGSSGGTGGDSSGDGVVEEVRDALKGISSSIDRG